VSAPACSARRSARKPQTPSASKRGRGSPCAEARAGRFSRPARARARPNTLAAAQGGNLLYGSGRSVVIRSIADPNKAELFIEHAKDVTVAKVRRARPCVSVRVHRQGCARGGKGCLAGVILGASGCRTQQHSQRSLRTVVYRGLWSHTTQKNGSAHPRDPMLPRAMQAALSRYGVRSNSLAQNALGGRASMACWCWSKEVACSPLNLMALRLVERSLV